MVKKEGNQEDNLLQVPYLIEMSADSSVFST